MTSNQSSVEAAPDSAHSQAAAQRSPTHPRAEERAESPSFSAGLLRFAGALVRRLRLVVGIPISAAIVMAGLSLIMRPAYTAVVTFVPEARASTRLPAGLTGLAGQLGLSLGGDASRSPDFYVQLVNSRSLLEAVLRSQYGRPGASSRADSATLLEILRVPNSPEARRLERGVEALRGMVRTSIGRQSGIVSLTVTAPDPVLAAAIANRFVKYLNEFNIDTRQSQARQRRQFAERRLAEAEIDLQRAEGDLRLFLQGNRQFDASPQLRFEHERLTRRVQLRQEVYLTLSRELETARIEQVNDAPVFTVIDSAVAPQTRSRPHRRYLVTLAFVVGLVGAVIAAVGAEYFQHIRREQAEDYQELLNATRHLRRGLGRFVSR